MIKRTIAAITVGIMLFVVDAAAYSTDEKGNVEICAVADLSSVTQNVTDDSGASYVVVDPSVAARTMSYTLFRPGIDTDTIYSADISEYISAVKAVGQAYAEDDGSYKISLCISGESGIYTLVVNNIYAGRTVFEIEHEARLYAEFNSIIESGDAAAMQRFVEDNADIVGFDLIGFRLLGDVEKSEIISRLLLSESAASNEQVSDTIKSLKICNSVFGYLTTSDDIASYIDNAVSGNISEFSANIFSYWQQLDHDAKVKTAAVFKDCAINDDVIDEFRLAIFKYQTSKLEYIRSWEEYFLDKDDIWGFDNSIEDDYQKSSKDNVLRDFMTATETAENMSSLRLARQKAVVDNMQRDNESESAVRGSGGGGGGKTGGTVYTSPIKYADDTNVTGNENKLVFSDMDAYQWAKDAVMSLASAGIVNGVGNGEFAPQKNVTREEFVKMLMAGLKLTGVRAEVEFSDVSKDSWYYAPIAAAVRSKIVNGSGNKFGVGEYISRQDMAVMLSRAVSNINAVLNRGSAVVFDDSDEISDYAYEAVSDMARTGILSGVGQNLFAPTKPLTRAEAAVALYRFLEAVDML